MLLGMDPRYTVYEPGVQSRLFRLAEHETTAFMSNHDRGTVPMPREDAALHRGFSALETEDHAKDYVSRFDNARKRGLPPRWGLILEFELDPARGHVVADTGREGHFTVWGDRFRVVRRIPI
jgi:hypothetical protein